MSGGPGDEEGGSAHVGRAGVRGVDGLEPATGEGPDHLETEQEEEVELETVQEEEVNLRWVE